jgi:hypothetical protein
MNPEKRKHIHPRHMREKNCLVNSFPVETERNMESFCVNKQLNVGSNIINKLFYRLIFKRIFFEDYVMHICWLKNHAGMNESDSNGF